MNKTVSSSRIHFQISYFPPLAVEKPNEFSLQLQNCLKREAETRECLLSLFDKQFNELFIKMID